MAAQGGSRRGGRVWLGVRSGEELPEPDEEAAEYEVDGVVRGRVRLHGSKQSTSGLQVDDERRNSLAERKYVRSVVKRGVGPSGGESETERAYGRGIGVLEREHFPDIR